MGTSEHIHGHAESTHTQVCKSSCHSEVQKKTQKNIISFQRRLNIGKISEKSEALFEESYRRITEFLELGNAKLVCLIHAVGMSSFIGGDNKSCLK